MPILAENAARYPKNWPAVSESIKQRAGWRCEGSPDFPECRIEHGDLGGRLGDGSWLRALPLGEGLRGLEWPRPGAVAACSDGTRTEQLRIVRIVLTVGHLDHQPENCDPDNLRAWCQRCHLHSDRHHHVETRRARRAAGDLFEDRS